MIRSKPSREERLKAIRLADRALQLVLAFYPEAEIERKPPTPERPKLLAIRKAGAA